MRFRMLAVIAASALLAVPALAAKDDFWNKMPSTEWTLEQVRDVLSKSPWVKTVEVFPAALKSKEEASSKPIGSVKRVGVYVRWYSAGILRHAAARAVELSNPSAPKEALEKQRAEITRPHDRFYIITVSAPESLGAIEPITLEELAKKSSLKAGDLSFPLVNVSKPSETTQPEALFYFDRGGRSIPAETKSATFETAFADLKLEAKFDLEKMVWNGQRDIDGDTLAGVTFDEKTKKWIDAAGKPVERDIEAEMRRREIQAAVLEGAEPQFARAITDVKVEKKGDPKRPWAVYVFYDPNRELSSPAEATNVDVMGRKRGIASRVGAWSASHKNTLEAVVFVDPAAGKATDYIVGADCEKLSKMAPEGGEAFFKKQLQKPK